MSAKAQRELIKGGPPHRVTKRGKSQTQRETTIPTPNTAERDAVLDRLKGKK